MGLPTDPTANAENEIVSGKEAQNVDIVLCSINTQAVGGLGPHQSVVQCRKRRWLKEIRNIMTSVSPHFFFKKTQVKRETVALFQVCIDPTGIAEYSLNEVWLHNTFLGTDLPPLSGCFA
jgi:hypothetical protein